MGKITLYFVLIISYLGLSTANITRERGSSYLVNENMLPKLFMDSPVCVILVGAFSLGYFFKTYYHQYKVVYGFRPPEYFVIKTSHEFIQQNEANLGLSLFRRSEQNNEESTIPMPPGALFIGNLAYGNWQQQDSGNRLWKFHRPYRHLAKDLAWGDFVPDFDFYQKMQFYIKQRTPFYGQNNEFGTNGTVSKNIIKKNTSWQQKFKFDLKKLWFRWISLNQERKFL